MNWWYVHWEVHILRVKEIKTDVCKLLRSPFGLLGIRRTSGQPRQQGFSYLYDVDACSDWQQLFRVLETEKASLCLFNCTQQEHVIYH